MASWASQGRPKEHPRPPKTLPFSPFCSNASPVLRFRKKRKRNRHFFIFFASDCVFSLLFVFAASPLSTPGTLWRSPLTPKGYPSRPRRPLRGAEVAPPGPKDLPRPCQSTFRRDVFPPNFSSPKFEIVENKSRTKVNNGRLRWSLASVAHTTESTFATVEPKGWRRWSREALLNKNNLIGRLISILF